MCIRDRQYTIGGTTEQDVKDFLKKNGVEDKADSTFSITSGNKTVDVSKRQLRRRDDLC